MHNFVPNWRGLHIHESSPSGPTFDKFLSNCKNYIPTYFFPNIKSGTMYQGFRCEDLARQTFEDDLFDIVITQDVLEHLLEPLESLKEIFRTLKPGGMHIFTVAWYYWQQTKIRVKTKGEEYVFCEPPEYHKNFVVGYSPIPTNIFFEKAMVENIAFGCTVVINRIGKE